MAFVNYQSDGTNKIKRIQFDYGGTLYNFVINPEEYSITEPNRATVTQTKAGGWVDRFGPGVNTITIKGTTGFKNGGTKGNSGFQKFAELRKYIRQYYNDSIPGSTSYSGKSLVFHNYTDNDHWVVEPQVFSLMRSVSRPLMYMYHIQLICLRLASMPSEKELASSTLKPTLSKVVN